MDTNNENNKKIWFWIYQIVFSKLESEKQKSIIIL